MTSAGVTAADIGITIANLIEDLPVDRHDDDAQPAIAGVDHVACVRLGDPCRPILEMDSGRRYQLSIVAI